MHRPRIDGSKIGRAALIAAAVFTVVGVVSFAWVWFAPCWLGGCAPVSELADYQAEGSELLDIAGEPIGTLSRKSSARGTRG